MEDKKENMVFNYADAPKSWYNCFNSECKKANECMHFMTGKNVPEDMTLGNAIYPNACKNGECRFFKQIRVMKGAYGFNTMLGELKRKEEVLLRDMITDYLGCNTTYYNIIEVRNCLLPNSRNGFSICFANMATKERKSLKAIDIFTTSANKVLPKITPALV